MKSYYSYANIPAVKNYKIWSTPGPRHWMWGVVLPSSHLLSMFVQLVSPALPFPQSFSCLLEWAPQGPRHLKVDLTKMELGIIPTTCTALVVKHTTWGCGDGKLLALGSLGSWLCLPHQCPCWTPSVHYFSLTQPKLSQRQPWFPALSHNAVPFDSSPASTLSPVSFPLLMQKLLQEVNAVISDVNIRGSSLNSWELYACLVLFCLGILGGRLGLFVVVAVVGSWLLSFVFCATFSVL